MTLPGSLLRSARVLHRGIQPQIAGPLPPDYSPESVAARPSARHRFAREIGPAFRALSSGSVAQHQPGRAFPEAGDRDAAGPINADIPDTARGILPAPRPSSAFTTPSLIRTANVPHLK